MSANESRRQLLRVAALTGVGLVSIGRSTNARADAPSKPADINATEDLMREHGVLRRVLLVYGEGLRQIEKGQTPPAEVLASAAGIIKRFVEGYHEKLEEEQLFPRMEKAGLQVELVHTLKAQHVAGRKLTDQILSVANATALAKPASRQALVTAAKSFIRMYEPHAAREDTILFPAFHALFTEKQ